MACTLRALFEPKSESLIIADCHLGKTSHFRKNNIPIPQKAALTDFQNLYFLLNHYHPRTCIFLGDLFHSTKNAEWQWLSLLLKDHKGVKFELILGNHDILPLLEYEKNGFAVLESKMLLKKVNLTHEPSLDTTIPNICGHIHPGFTIYGKARQAVTLPCFYIGNNQLILPSFGNLTGQVSQNGKVENAKALCFTKNEFFMVQ